MSQRSALSADESCSDRSSPAPTTPTEVHTTLQTLLYRGLASSTESPPNSIVFIDLLPSPSGSASKSFVDYPMPSSNEDEHMWTERGLNVVKISPHPRHISEIDPTVTFTSPTPITAVSVFSVYLNDDLVHSEEAPLKSHGQLTMENAHLYSTHLLPDYWAKMCQMSDLSRHTIVHRVVEDRSSSSSLPSPSGPKVLFSTMYRFKYSTQSLPLQPTEFHACSDFVTAPADKHSLEYFDSVLSISPSDCYYSDSKPQTFYELPSWNNGPH
ncbi:hypothetical protein EST38_g12602 [Candolleomyces aberdarensis]|uniref:Uncharacterized protein n=1 Tax=Candolleomyces aberdarensis TaxID=2316362 RepID=A0A4Q2D214_9AGAR|nr:hypothetical protein EST38_g12602 [Candolleomyces aberdarensis]